MFKQFFRFWRNKKRDRINKTTAENLIKEIDPDKLPRHIAIIMDGNGRWALRHGMPRSYGHRAGVESLKDIVRFCSDLKVKILTVYAFSTENWKRPPEEVSILMDLLVEYFEREIDELHRNKVKVCPIGKMQNLPPAVMRSLRMAEERTRDNDGLILNVAFNYGGRQELVDAVKAIVEDVTSGRLSTTDINEDTIAQHLYTAGQPDPDLLIRPAGDLRISNFLLWQLAYTEFWISPIMWPDFRRADLMQAILDYQQRERRFGGLKK